MEMEIKFNSSYFPSRLPRYSLGIIGCGKMGTAVLSGILSFLCRKAALDTENKSNESEENLRLIPTSVTLSVLRPESCVRIEKALAPFNPIKTDPKNVADICTPSRQYLVGGLDVKVFVNENEAVAHQSDVIIIGCKPYTLKDIFSEIQWELLKGKLLISLLAGMTCEMIYSSVDRFNCAKKEFCVLRAMPNTASLVQQSITVLNREDIDNAPKIFEGIINWIFSCVGRIIFVSKKNMAAATALAGSGPAFAALILEALADGGVGAGLPRDQAQLIAAQVMRGTAELVMGQGQDKSEQMQASSLPIIPIAGQHPALVREAVTTPAGCTAVGLAVLESGAVRGIVGATIRETASFVENMAKKI